MKKCCTNCFKDKYFKSYVENNGNIGNCSYCGSTDIMTVEVDRAIDISEKLTRLLQIYSVSKDRRAKRLSLFLKSDWDIFNLEERQIVELSRDLCSDIIHPNDDIYAKNVWFPQEYDISFVEEYGITRNHSWKEFSECLKYSNRFFSGMFNADAFISYLSSAVRVFHTDDLFYRARICDVDVERYPIERMGIPPINKRNAGRINPVGIGVLYLSLDDKTVLYEVRASKYDKISIGEFKPNTEIRVIDLSQIESLSPFSFDDNDMVERYAINKKIIKDIAVEIAKPMRRNDSVLDYLPTQFIAEFVKFQGYDGVAYKSTVYEGGYNVALFDESKVSCVNVESREVVDIHYESNVIKQ